MLDITSQVDVSVCIAPIAVADNTAQVGSTIDLSAYSGVDFVVQTGVLADADATFAVQLFEGNASNMSDETEVTSADSINGTKSDFTFANDSVAYHFGYRGNKRYVRVKITPTNNASSAPVSACAILRKAKIGSL